MRRLRVGKANVSYMATPNGYKIQQDSNGNLGIFRADGTELGYWTQNRFIFVGQNGINFEMNLASQGPINSYDSYLFIDNGGTIHLSANTGNGSGDIILNESSPNRSVAIISYTQFRKIANQYNNIATVGIGLSAIYGLDNRTGLTAVDSSPITLYPISSLQQPAIASGQLYRLSGRILATAGTSPSATYTLKWTEGGTVITKSLTISALNSDSDFSALIQPDANTSITAQLTAIAGTGTTVNVASSVERLA